jgi:hypothetical protein
MFTYLRHILSLAVSHLLIAHKDGFLVGVRRSRTIGKALLYYFPRSIRAGG